MDEELMSLDKKSVSVYKNTLKSINQIASKYGFSGNNTSTYFSLYHFIGDKVIYPVAIMNQEVNPWGAELVPIKGFIKPVALGDNVNLEIGDKEYTTGATYRCNYETLKGIIESISGNPDFTINVITGEVSLFKDKKVKELPTKQFSDNYSDAIKELIELSREKGFSTVSDEMSINTILSELLTNTNFGLVKDGDRIQLYSSVLPMPFTKLDYFRLLSSKDNTLTSKIFLRYYTKDVQVGVFYQYLDVYEYKKTLKEETK